ncbi:hypothetical protein E2C01_079589 [Portunus trituberculatus]|uniref:Uncharacterized protein n=1 Tax=Portunus trituberculatus TaxID=210409 RepID=A0A5B7IRT3_PORTR|nr:hypothetical protein [Portunus trituberculatus]
MNPRRTPNNTLICKLHRPISPHMAWQGRIIIAFGAKEAMVRVCRNDSPDACHDIYIGSPPQHQINTPAPALNSATSPFLIPKPKPKRKQRSWVWPYLQKRLRYRHYDTLMDELYKENPDLYKNYTRMDKELFDSIVETMTPIIKRKED